MASVVPVLARPDICGHLGAAPPVRRVCLAGFGGERERSGRSVIRTYPDGNLGVLGRGPEHRQVRFRAKCRADEAKDLGVMEPDGIKATVCSSEATRTGTASAATTHAPQSS